MMQLINYSFWRRTSFLFVFSFVTFGPAQSQQFDIRVAGINRTYRLHIPRDLPSQAPLVFVLHGYSGNSASIENYSEMNSIAEENNFAVCYPQGLRDQWNATFWNVGYSFHNNQTVDDILFLTTLATTLQSTYNLSPSQTFCTGMSNGGDMSYLLACEASDVFSAVAPIAGTMMEGTYIACQDSNPIPVFEIHGTHDNITYWEGDINDNQGYGPYLDVMTVFEFWADLNNCTDFKMENLSNINSGDGSTVTSLKYSGGINGNQVWLYRINNGGHDWPGNSGNMDINASKEIWNFFSLFAPDRVLEVPSVLEIDTNILENFPNPFTSTTIINYALTEEAMVVLNINDLMGKKINTLVNQTELPGKKSLLWTRQIQQGLRLNQEFI
ncbi:MAG: hypothetical protein JXR07_01310 [Reichenbachiella sp.]